MTTTGSISVLTERLSSSRCRNVSSCRQGLRCTRNKTNALYACPPNQLGTLSNWGVVDTRFAGAVWMTLRRIKIMYAVSVQFADWISKVSTLCTDRDNDDLIVSYDLIFFLTWFSTWLWWLEDCELLFIQYFVTVLSKWWLEDWELVFDKFYMVILTVVLKATVSFSSLEGYRS